jgi:hypothetical protein
MPTDDDNSNQDEPPAKTCRVCGKVLAGIYFLTHVRFGHPVQWENWHSERGGFGMSIYNHIAVTKRDEE